MVHYRFINALGSGDGYGPDYNAYLLFNADKSYYVSAKDSLETEASLYGQKIIKDKEGSVVAVVNGIKSSKVGDQVAIDRQNKQMFSSYSFKGDMIYWEETNHLDWNITAETKKIGSFIANKATTNYHGRDYTVWFVPEIPVPYGPWKFNGLPGLIVEAYDKGKYVWWVFKDISYPSETREKVHKVQFLQEDKDQVYSSFKEYLSFINEAYQRLTEKNLIIEKETGVTILSPKINQIFIEYKE